MTQLLCASEVAAKLGCSDRTVSRLAAKYDVGQWCGRMRVFTSSDIAYLREYVQHGQERRLHGAKDLYKSSPTWRKAHGLE